MASKKIQVWVQRTDAAVVKAAADRAKKDPEAKKKGIHKRTGLVTHLLREYGLGNICFDFRSKS
jgi:hypothetical protein